MGRSVIARYLPKPGKEAALLEVIRDHLAVLRQEGLATDRPAHVMRAADGSHLEVFEWASSEAIEAAHTNPAVEALWERFGDACEYVSLAGLAETGELFAEFETIDL